MYLFIYTVYNLGMDAIHIQALEAARQVADESFRFKLADVVRALPFLNAATVRTHVASRCCVNASANHQSRYGYFRSVGRGEYRIEPRYRRATTSAATMPSQDRLIALGSGVDQTLIDASLRMSPTDRLETMRRTALALQSMQG